MHLQRDQQEDEVEEVLQPSVKSEPMGQAGEVGDFQEEEEGAMVVAGYGDDYGEYGEEYNGQVYGGGGVDPTTDNRGEMIDQFLSLFCNALEWLDEYYASFETVASSHLPPCLLQKWMRW